MKFSATACVVLAAGATAQVLPGAYAPLPGAFAPRAFSPYTFPRAVIPGAVAPAAPAVSREELLQQLQAAATPEALAQAAAIKDDLVKTQSDLAKAQSGAKKASLKARKELYDLQAYLTTDADKIKKAKNNANLYNYKAKETSANKAYEAFVKSPSRKTSLKAEAADASAKIALLKAWGHSDADDESFGRGGQYQFQSVSAKNTIAADALHAAESALGVDGDAPAYFEALQAFERANEELWWQTFTLQGKTGVAEFLENKHAIEDYERAWATYEKSKDPSDIEGADYDHLKSYIEDESGLKDAKKFTALMDYQKAQEASTAAQKKPQTLISQFVQRNPTLASRFPAAAPRPAFGGRAGFYGLGR